MKKLLISILIILLLVLCGFAVTKGYNIGDFTVLGAETRKEKNEQLDESIGQATKLASIHYPKAISGTEADLKKLTQEKKNYEEILQFFFEGTTLNKEFDEKEATGN